MVEQLGASNIYTLGVWLGFLEGTVSPEGITWGRVREALQYFARCKNFIGLESIGTEAQRELLSFARKYRYSYSRQFSKEDCASLNTLVNSWYGRIEEISKRWVLQIPRTKLDISKLNLGGISFFEGDEWSALSELEQKGINEAVTCLLTNNFTAAEFMILRTVESVLRRWYEHKTNKNIDFVNQGAILALIDEEYWGRMSIADTKPLKLPEFLHNVSWQIPPGTENPI